MAPSSNAAAAGVGNAAGEGNGGASWEKSAANSATASPAATVSSLPAAADAGSWRGEKVGAESCTLERPPWPDTAPIHGAVIL
jgi:hypothetical protein